jgi:DNA-binding PadR family transcriptional regulator
MTRDSNTQQIPSGHHVQYLDMLVRFGLLEVRGGSEKSYIATEKGRRFLEDYRELQKYSEIARSKKRALESTLAITS